MVETLFLDWGISFGTGLLFGLAGGTGASIGARAFRWGAAYLAAGVISIAVTVYALNPDWMWMYWVDADRIPVAVVVLAFAMYPVAFVAGYALAPALERARRGAGVALAIAVGACTAAAILAARDRLLRWEDAEAAFTLGAGAVSVALLAALLVRVARPRG